MKIDQKLVGYSNLVFGFSMLLIVYFDHFVIDSLQTGTIGQIVDVGLGILLISLGLFLLLKKRNNQAIELERSQINTLVVLLITSVLIFVIIGFVTLWQN